MAPILLFLLLTSFVTSSFAQNLRSTDQEAFISILITQQGLDFTKNLLINKASSLKTRIHLPKLEGTVKIPLLGHVKIVISNITINEIDVASPYVKPGDAGLAINASGATCSLSMNWYYQFHIWFLPLEISDKGTGSVKVGGMQLGLTLGLKNNNGTLNLSLEEPHCFLKDISLKLEGGASWLYQRLIDAFEKRIRATTENIITNKLQEGILKLDSLLQALPKEIPINDNVSLDITFANDPILSNSSIEFDFNGLITRRSKISIPTNELKSSQPSVFCSDPSKMFGISLDEAVFNSALALYYDGMRWIVDKLPGQDLLNTAKWKFIIPTLYMKYPDAEMNLNLSLSSPPVIRISESGINATVHVDLILNVLKADEAIPIAGISLDVQGLGSVKISGNKLSGNVKVGDFSLSMKWSNIGNIKLSLIKPVISTLARTALVPFANKFLEQGFPLPTIHGFGLKNVDMNLSDSKIIVCGDVEFGESQHHNQLLLKF